MRILCVHPGASISVSDVHAGLIAALAARGHQIFDYALDARIERSGAWLDYCWKKGKKTGERPVPADVLYHAGEPLVARTMRALPDVVLVVSAMYLHPDIFVLLRRAGVPVAVLFTESPYDDAKQARLLPYVKLAWTNERSSARALGIRYLPHAYNAAVHTPTGQIGGPYPSHDVVFVGTGFQERIDTLAAVDWTGIDLGLYGSWDLLGSRHHLRAHIRGGYVDNAQTVELYRRAKIGLNLYRTSQGFGKDAPRITAAESLNPRAYELAATGCFTISDGRPEVAERFGDLVPTFETPDQIRPLVDHWLADDAGRATIRHALPAAIAADTWDARAIQVEHDLREAGIGLRPPSSLVDLPCTGAAVDVSMTATAP